MGKVKAMQHFISFFRLKLKIFMLKKLSIIIIALLIFSNAKSTYIPKSIFIKNEGQVASLETKMPVNDVLYYVQTPNSIFYIKKTGLSYFFLKHETSENIDNPVTTQTKWQRIDVNFIGGNLSNVIELKPSSWHYNFYYPHCPNGIRNVKGFKELVFKEVYKGIDFKIYFNENNELKYDFIVAPKADPSKIMLTYTYSNPLIINGNGEAIAENLLGTIIEKKPVGYQNNKIVDIDWKLSDNYTLTFNIKQYDKNLPLIIDPFLIWSTFYGGVGNDVAQGITSDGTNVIVAGSSSSNNIPTSDPGIGNYFQGSTAGNDDLFIAKFDNNGVLEWATYYGGSLTDQKAKPYIFNNYIYISAQTNSTDIPTYNPGGSAFYQNLLNGDGLDHGGTPDGFIIKFSLNGDLLWSTYFGGIEADEVTSLAATTNNLFAYLISYSSTLPMVDPGGAYQESYTSYSKHAYFARFTLSDNQLTWGTYFGQGNTGGDWSSIACDASSLYAAINTSNNSIPVTNMPGAYFDNTYNGGSKDGLIIKFNEHGVLLWSTYFGGNGDDDIRSCTFANNKLWIAGHTNSNSATFPLADPGNGAYFQNTIAGSYDGFIASFDANSGQLIWSTFYGGNSTDYIRDIKEDNYGVFICGSTNSSNFPLHDPGTPTFFNNTQSATFIAKFKQNGIRQWSTFFSGSLGESRKLAVSNDAVYMTGFINNSLLTQDPGNGAYFDNTFNGGTWDAFIAKFDKCVIPQTSVTASSLQICKNDSVWIYGSGGVSYLWSTTETTDSIHVAPQSTTTFYVSITDDMACSNIDSINITVFPLPDVNITGDHAICFGDSITLYANGAQTYLWQPINTNTDSIIISPSITTTYYLLGTDSNGCQKIDSAEIIVHPLPPVSISGFHPICKYDSLWLYAHGAQTYIWTPGNYPTDSIYISPDTTTTFYVTGTDHNGCRNTDSVTVIVYPLPSVSISGHHPICFGDSITLYANGAQFYLWTPGNITTDSIVVAPLFTTTYYLLGTDTNNCKNLDSTEIVVYPLPNVQLLGAHPICFGDSITLTASGALTYLWLPDSLVGYEQTYSPQTTSTYVVIGTDFHQCKNSDTATIIVHTLPNVQLLGAHPICYGDSLTLTAINAQSYWWNTNDTTSNITVNPGQTFDFIVVGTDSNGCINSDTATVIVYPLPNVQILGTHPICLYDSITLVATGANIYTWAPWGYQNSAITISPSQTTDIILTGIDINGCINSDTVQLVVYPLPIVSVSGVQPICFGDSITITAHGASSYIWLPDSLSGAIQNLSPTQTTNYTVVGTDTNQCKNTTNFEIVVYELPVASISGINRICQQESVVLTASGGDSYIWNTQETSPTITVQPMSTTTYSVVAIKNICSDTAYFTLFVDEKPQLTITSDTTIIIGMTVPLHVSGATNYQWTPINYLSCYTCPNPISHPSETIEYCVEGINTYGCSDTICVTITVDKECGEVFVPSGFSPNNDGNNDVLYVRGKCIKSMQFSVFNRWGEKVFESSSPEQGWDGTFRGKPLDTGVFVYYLQTEYYNGIIIKKQGNITLIR